MMYNRFKGTCYRCGKTVPAGKGVVSFERRPRDRWNIPNYTYSRNGMTLVEHRECREKYAGSDVHHIFNPSKEKRTANG